jgi:hypothetical protein
MIVVRLTHKSRPPKRPGLVTWLRGQDLNLRPRADTVGAASVESDQADGDVRDAFSVGLTLTAVFEERYILFPYRGSS